MTEQDIRLASALVTKAKKLLRSGYDDYADVQRACYELDNAVMSVDNLLVKFMEGTIK